MKRTLLLIVIIFTIHSAEAQFIKEKYISAKVGLGVSFPYNSTSNVADNGLFAQGEFVLKVTSWFELRPYAGLILTRSNGRDLNDNPTDEKAESRAFLLGGKARLRAPIPWIAPYLEFGFGTSIGSFNTFTTFDNIDRNGVIYHIPIAFGLELGKAHNVDLGFAYFMQPSVEQVAGALAVGLTFKLN